MTMNEDTPYYPEVPDKPNFVAFEEEILSFWESDNTFEASVALRPIRNQDGSSNEFVFYDGPPFANGLPHYGHLLTGFAKDAIPRYWTMRGKHVERRFGWDCHGLPAEIEAERELGVSGRQNIESYGIENFNSYCRSLVLRTTDTWERYVNRQARWVDMKNDYKTMDLSYMESVIWAFKELYKKSLIYEGYRVLPYCWECETPLSNFETRQDDAYRLRSDPAVTVKFKVVKAKSLNLSSDLYLLIWTTTPWTLPSNLAIGVGKDIEYVILKVNFQGNEQYWIIARERLNTLQDVIGQYEVIKTVKGLELNNLEYEPIFDFFKDVPNAFKVVVADFVSTEEGTGLVHLAPGFGEDDFNVCTQNNINVVCPVDERGRFTSEVKVLEGKNVFESNEVIIKDLEKRSLLIKKEEYLHSYPHCWRTDTPLIYKAISSWFVAVTKIKDKMLELNEQINWIPEHVKNGAFGNWLKNARDWSISRNRFWGAPIPVWKSDDPKYPRIDVYGSIEELEKDFNTKIKDLHRPYIDELIRPNPDDPTGKSTMRRVADVLDCWFESGSMPFAEVHFPFENKAWFEEHFPADFIVEYIGQVRGWFYTLHVLATALFERPPFIQCLTHGVVLGNDGRKLSKRLKNYPDPEEVFKKYGADAMRWFLLSGPGLKGQDFVIEESGFDAAVKQVLNPLWNSFYFLVLYSRADEMRGEFRLDYSEVLDRYIVAKVSKLVSDLKIFYEKADLSGAAKQIEEFLDSLTNWYIRRSRDRFWSSKNADEKSIQQKKDAYDALHSTLILLLKAAAPLLPLLTEYIYKHLTNDRSIHLTDWPSDDMLVFDNELVESMDLVRQICSGAHSIRKANNIRARLPLRLMVIATNTPDKIEPYLYLIKDEVNVKEIKLSNDFSLIAEKRLTVDPAKLGPRLGSLTPKVIKGAKEANYVELENGIIVVDGIELKEGEAALKLVAKDEKSSKIIDSQKLAVSIDLTLDEELIKEGLARDIIRYIQTLRKDAGLNITDRIKVEIITADQTFVSVINLHRDYIKEQILAVSLNEEPLKNSLLEKSFQIANTAELKVRLAKA